ncbi:unnamed protein product [Phytophthora fragariaefolia]|uniref:Unnamed protein product n=1 Tax=Phytophthora fragariaefolia TaxID=1490495 RepID=A0A9W6Y4B8_9STRA|nr:unnamed protein product [Phytophthora fragariaefolia]
MSAVATETSGPTPAPPPVDSTPPAPTTPMAEPTDAKPAAPSSPESATASEYELSSDEEDDEEPEVVEVTPPRSRQKRKAVTLDLLASPTPATKRRALEEDSQAAKGQLADKLKEIRSLASDAYSVTVHNELASFVKSVFAAADKFDEWQPRDDPTLARLLNEMEKRMGVFKDSAAQEKRSKAVSDWQQEMTAVAFVPSLDLVSLPPKIDSSVAIVDVSGCGAIKVYRRLFASLMTIVSKTASDTSKVKVK